LKNGKNRIIYRLINDLIRILAALPGLFYFRPRIIYAGGKRRHYRGGLLIISNHICFFDPEYLLYAFWYRRLFFVCMKEFYSNKFKAFWFRCFGTIPIDRENPGLDSFREITDELKAGSAVTVFPGGHIDNSQTGIDSFKSGMVLMALKAGVPVLPVLLVRKKHWYSRLCVIVGEAVDIKKECGATVSFADIGRMTKLIIEREKSLSDLVPEKYR